MKFVRVCAFLMLTLVVAQAFAQESETNTIRFNDFSFSFDPALATHVSISQYLTSPDDVFPPQGIHTHFAIYGEQPPDNSIVGIRVYRIDDLAAYEHTQQQVTELQNLLTNQSDLAQYTESTESALPFLPVVAAGQTIRARAQYVGTPDVSGISYVTAFQQAAEPLLQNNFLYTFQGISTDGVYYVSAVFRVNPASFPSEIPADFDYQGFLNQLPDYISDSTLQLNSAEPETFSPSLSVIDAVVQSFDFDA